MPRDRDDERSDRREAPARNYGDQGRREQGQPGRGPPVRGGRGDQQPPEGGQQRGGQHRGGQPQGTRGQQGHRQQGGGQYQGGQQPQQGQPGGGFSQRGGSGRQQGGGGRSQHGGGFSQQGGSGGQQGGGRRQQRGGFGQQTGGQQGGQTRQQQPPRHGQTPPRQPEQTPSRQGSGQQSRPGGQTQGGQQQSGQQQGGYVQQGQARVSGDWHPSGGASQAQQAGGRATSGRQGDTQQGRGTPGLEESGGGSRSIQPRTVDEIMTEDVVTASGDTPLHDVAAKMASEEVGSVIVVDDDGSPTGIITDRTIALSIDDEGTLAERTVSDVMAGDVVTVTEGTSVFEVTQRLADSGVRRLPVINGEGSLQGIISIDDVVVLLSQELENVSDVLEAQSHRF